MENLIEDFFREADINIHKQYEHGDTVYSSDLDLGSGTFNLCIIISHEYEGVTVFINSPIKVPEPKRADVAEYIARANYHFYEGNIMLDFGDGRLVYKYSIRYDSEDDIQHIWQQLNNCLWIGIDEMEKHFPGITTVIFNDAEPLEAFQETELGSDANLN